MHQTYMRRALQLAKSGVGRALPNPSVGCVIVHEGHIIGEGFTSPYGGPHAEVNAIDSVTDKSMLANATLYVTLEPCAHQGKTPPCADLIVAHKIPEVVIGIMDPNKKVAGKGIQKLEIANCQVITGMLEKECREHHRRFLTYQEKKRPYIILKWAETRDGLIAPSPEKRAHPPEPYWITNPLSRQLVHQWRSEEQAILVGTTTVLEDNPKLTLRDWVGKNPLRVVLDRNLKIPAHFQVLDGSVSTLVLTEVGDVSKYRDGVHYAVLDFSNDLAEQITEVLYQQKIASILIEGGTRTLQTFIEANLWDEARVFTGPNDFTEGLRAPQLDVSEYFSKTIDTDTLTIYRNA